MNTRELLLCDKPVGEGVNTVAWVDVFGGFVAAAEDPVLDSVEGHELVAELRRYMQRVPRRSRYDGCDLVDLFDAVIVQIRANGRIDLHELRAQFGLGATAMHSWMWWLRANLCHALGRPVPRRRATTAAGDLL